MERPTALVRPAARADIGDLATLVAYYWAFEEIDGFSRTRIEALLQRLLQDPRLGSCWVAESNGAICGYLLAVFMLSLEYGGLMAEIDEFFVYPAHRSSGAGRELLRVAEEAMRAAGCVRVQLQLGATNDQARGFYLRHGYGKRTGYDLLDKGLGE